MNFFEELKWRGLVNDITSPELIEKINEGGLKFYIGVDPTGDSMHIGHYSSVIATTKRLLDKGHQPIILVGGGTGLIGDPKPNVERPMITKEQVKHNIDNIKKQIETILKTDVVIENNASWLLGIDAIDYLRDYGKYFNINYMLAKDTVKRRLDIGITYTEFSYMILQSIDFLKLYERQGVTLQIGGQDQWGNITSGLELIRKIHGNIDCYGLTMPLITRADGSKFGKSESGEALWLDINKTSSYEMFQYFINTEDSKVIEYIKKLTFLSVLEIKEIEKQHLEKPELRLAQKTLAKEIITFLHGQKEFNKAQKISEVLFSGEIFKLSYEEILEAFKNMDVKNTNSDTIINFLVDNKVTSSKREAREFVKAGSIYINGQKIIDENYEINSENAINNNLIVLRRGKKRYYIFKLDK
ncbi:MAG: tyrosine--tRNA ligase [Mycoplasmatota bacterium]